MTSDSAEQRQGSDETLCAECHHPLREHGRIINTGMRRRVNACDHTYHQGWFRRVTCLCESFRSWFGALHSFGEVKTNG